MAFQLARRAGIVVLMVPTWHESGFGKVSPDCGPGVGRGGRGRQRARVTREFGIDGESSGKDGVNTNRRSSLVFLELRRVTCGVVVHKAVDNYRDVRITGGILWTRCGQEKNPK